MKQTDGTADQISCGVFQKAVLKLWKEYGQHSKIYAPQHDVSISSVLPGITPLSSSPPPVSE